MQARLHSFIPINPPPVSKLHPTLIQNHRLLGKTCRAVTISPPSNPQVSYPAIEESVEAFWDYQFLFVSQRSETFEPVSLRAVEGSIPRDFPSGTYYLVGPGLFTDDHGSTVHPLDGHGYLRAFVVDGPAGQAGFTARYIKTEAQVEERDPVTGRWRFTHRGPFSVLKGGRKVGNTKVMKNVANTSVLRWGGRLLCLWEGGDPYEIESGTLDTVGKFNVIDGCDSSVPAKGFNVDALDLAARLLKPILHGVFKMPPKRLLSHYKIDAKRDRLLIASCNAEDMLLPRSNFTFYEYDSEFKLLQKQDFEIPDHLMIHDWAFTDSHYILFANRIKLDVLGSMTAVCGISPMISALSLNPSKPTTPIYMLPRCPSKSRTSGRDWRNPIEAPSQLWLMHVGNAYEETDENGNSEVHIQACACSYRWFTFHKMFGESEEKMLPHLVEVSISLDSTGDSSNCSVKSLKQWNKATDFPVINPKFSGSKHTYAYAATCLGSRQTLPHFPFDTVVKVNAMSKSAKTWSVGSRRFIGEPIFVPKGAEEDDGYLLVVEYAVAIQRCFLNILDPRKIGEADALVAKLEVPRHLNFPMGFHGFWAHGDM
ncbi:Carotenoid oxygenase [Dillenia turbinata]|uniref:Carotenoid oxygenase n=1 Tax=Dillenia turbinata TaxID=194707 RepID=A0AAN8UQH3_9MAGN